MAKGFEYVLTRVVKAALTQLLSFQVAVALAMSVMITGAITIPLTSAAIDARNEPGFGSDQSSGNDGASGNSADGSGDGTGGGAGGTLTGDSGNGSGSDDNESSGNESANGNSGDGSGGTSADNGDRSGASSPFPPAATPRGDLPNNQGPGDEIAAGDGDDSDSDGSGNGNNDSSGNDSDNNDGSGNGNNDSSGDDPTPVPAVPRPVPTPVPTPSPTLPPAPTPVPPTPVPPTPVPPTPIPPTPVPPTPGPDPDPVSDLSVAIANPGDLTVGIESAFTVTVTNAGPLASAGTTLVVELSGATSAAVAGCETNPAGNVTCELGVIAIGSSVEIAVPITATASGTVGITAKVDGSNDDPTAANNAAEASASAVDPGDLSIAIGEIDGANRDGSVTAGSSLSVAFTVNNNGPATEVNDVSVAITIAALTVEVLPEGCELSSATTLTCSLGQVGANPVALKLGATVSGIGEISIVAEVHADLADLDPSNNTDTVSAAITAGPADLGVVLTAPNEVVVGVESIATVSASNNGPFAANPTIVEIRIPGAIVGDVAGCQTSGDDALTCDLGELESGDSADIDVAFTPTAPGATAASAEVSGPGEDLNVENNAASTEINAVTVADLTVAIEGPDKFIAGANSEVLVSVSNDGPSPSTGFALTIDLQNALTDKIDGCELSKGSIFTCELGPLAAGSSTDLTVSVTPIVPGTVTISALAEGNDQDPDQQNNADNFDAEAVAAADLAVQVSPIDQMLVGVPATVTIEVSNAGPSNSSGATLDIEISGAVPGRVPGCQASDTSTLTCDLDAIVVNAAVQVSFEILANEPGNVAVAAVVSGLDDDPNPADNRSTAETSTEDNADISVVFDDSVGLVVGTESTISASISNAGPSASSGATVDIAIVGAIAGQAEGCAATEGGLTCAIGALEVNTSTQIEIPITATAPGLVTINVSAEGNELDGNEANNDAETSIEAVSVSDLSVDISEPEELVVGVESELIITVSNAGPSPAPLASLQLGLNGAATAAGANCSYEGETDLTCDLGDLEVGGSIELVIGITANEPGPINITATASSNADDPNPDNDTAAFGADAVAVADLSLAIGGPTELVVGVASEFTISIANAGPSTSTSGTVDINIGNAEIGNVAGCEPGETTLTCSFENLTAAASIDFTIQVTPTEPGEVVVFASAFGDDEEPTPEDNTAETKAEAESVADLSVEIGEINGASEDGSVPLGAEIVIPITFRNNGPDPAVEDVTATILTTGLDIGAIPAGCDFAEAGLTCSLDLVTAEPTVIQLAAIVGEPIGDDVADTAVVGGEITITATVGSNSTDPEPANNTDSASALIVGASSDLIIGLAPVGELVINGSGVVVISLTNNGTAPIAGITASLSAEGAEVVPTRFDSPDCTIDAGNLTCEISELAGGESRSIYVHLAVGDEKGVAITATVDAPGFDPDPSNNTVVTGPEQPPFATVEEGPDVVYVNEVVGDATIIGNTSLSCGADNTPARRRSITCGDIRDAHLYPDALTRRFASNNVWPMRFVDADKVDLPRGFDENSSGADLVIPDGATIEFAGLYWGAKQTPLGKSGNVLLSNQPLGGIPDSIDDYTKITATSVQQDSGAYQGFADVTNLVSETGTVWVAGIDAKQLVNTHAAWSLIVVWSGGDTPRNITVFDSFAMVRQSDPLSLSVGGFASPENGQLKLGMASYESDLGLTGESLRITTFDADANPSGGAPYSDPTNPADDIFNSTISNDGQLLSGPGDSTHQPSYANTLGFDLDIFSIDAPNAASATFEYTTHGDVYWVGPILITGIR